MATLTDPREMEADRAAAARDFAGAEKLLSALAADNPGRGPLWYKLAAMRRAQRDNKGALDAVSNALRLDPLAFPPLLLKATLVDELGDEAQAAELYAAVLFHCPPADKMSPGLSAEIAHVRSRHESLVAKREAALDKVASASFEKARPRERRRIERFRSNVLRKTRPWHPHATHFHFPGLAEIEFFEPEDFPQLAALEAAADTIREEFETLVASEKRELVPYVQAPEDQPSQMPELNNSPDWSALHLIQLGRRVEANARHCPATLAAYEGTDQADIPGRGPNLMFSLLAPRTRIPAHHGVTNARVVFHLPLIVPPNCGFRVGGETREWEPGKVLIFDDTIEHEAWNDSGELRVVLIGDLWRPELTSTEREAVSAIVSAA